ncbi:MAG TPA: hypothetical protein VI544_01110 [Candidatus Nanoarchaeia archaeon]|nr:hypothetical protein [Candidatus Nanoarchaeia archaeon]
MKKHIFNDIEQEYEKAKIEFQTRDNFLAAKEIANQIEEYSGLFTKIFSFLINSFKGQLRRDKETPLVFHSVYLTKLLYSCGEKNQDTLLIASLHDVLEDTEISEEELKNQDFLKDKQYIINQLKTLKEDKSLSREPDGKNLPPRYKEHIKRIIGASKEVINVEVLDRFCDLIDLDYITKLPKEQKDMRIKSKVIKVKSFIENITRNRNDINKYCLDLFFYKLNKIEREFNVSVKAETIF